MKDYEFRPANSGDLSRFSRLMGRCFRLEVDRSYFDWKWRQGPAGPVVGFEALWEGRTVGFYGVLPEHWTVRGEPVLIHQSMDTMTDPDHQRRGLLVKLATLTYDEVRRQTGSFIAVGFAGTQSYHGMVNRLGWANPRGIQYWFAHRLHVAGGGAGRVRAETVDHMDEQVSRYITEREPAACVAPLITDRWLRWRVLEHRLRPHRLLLLRHGDDLLGICAYRTDEKGRAVIGWLDLRTDADARAVASTAVREVLRRTGSDWLYTWKPSDPRLGRALRSAGMLSNPWRRGPFSFRVPFITRSDSPTVFGVRWDDSETFDLQPVAQD